MSSTPSSKALSFELEIATSREAQDRGPTLAHAVGGAEPEHQLGAVLAVHVDHAHMGTPSREDRLRLRQASGRPHHEEAVVEGQLDEVDDQWAVVEDHGATSGALDRIRLCFGRGADSFRGVGDRISLAWRLRLKPSARPTPERGCSVRPTATDRSSFRPAPAAGSRNRRGMVSGQRLRYAFRFIPWI